MIVTQQMQNDDIWISCMDICYETSVVQQVSVATSWMMSDENDLQLQLRIQFSIPLINLTIW